ncbi:MAG: hypothetical protein JXD22_13815 [Sedimentisphaerales bacterium]|nr:hypothetical protein [Sedimentisphaerales bacterium]
MAKIDVVTLSLYLIGLLVVGGYFSNKMTNSLEMFTAGGRSPWWVSGLSGFMSIFSAGTFVVWGGIAFRCGMVAVSILMVISISLFGIGIFLAGKWKEMGITTPAEYVEYRFGETAVQIYAWLGLLCRIVCMAIGLYALSVMLAALIPVSQDSFFYNPESKGLSIYWLSIVCGGTIVIYTMAGGLWAVLMTDVIQSIVLCLSIAIAVPLSFMEIGGVRNFITNVPEGFFSLATKEFSIGFLLLWTVSNFFQFGADWAFIQRYICVPTAKDAKKAAYLMGWLYVISPLFWMLPAMIYRLIDPGADPEQAYILICEKVMPAGMLGVVIAAMFSATASMISTHLNVFAGVFTKDIYKPLFCKSASERHLVFVGRIITLIYGILVIVVANLIPSWGGAEKVVLSLVMMFFVPMLVPAAWGIYSKKISTAKLFWVLAISYTCGIFVKLFLLRIDAILLASDKANGFLEWLKANVHVVEGITGLFIPLLLLLFFELLSIKNKTDSGWQKLQDHSLKTKEENVQLKPSRLPALMTSCVLGILGVMMLSITVFVEQDRTVLLVFAALLLTAALGIYLYTKKYWVNTMASDMEDN